MEMNTAITCPFCGELTELDLGGDAESSEPAEHVLVQDCDVCCAPIPVRLTILADGTVNVNVERE